ncbi:MAG TPA: phosphate regulon transcriptional regulator PhoB [Pseudomonadales bacterium]|jgi:two-component system phosphate regulon response regulator PhoB|nr:phosphate regulon transcriptional regulator PhoB [Pseudomonadales bacterium]
MTTQTVLLVEDEPEIRDMLTFALNRAGFNTLGAGSAEEALQLLDGPMPAVAVIDWMLPGASGIDLARRLRRDELFADLPMIMLTARGEEADKLKGFDSGVDDYLTKPFSPRELIARIRALQRRAGGAVDGRLSIGPLTVDLKSHRLMYAETPIHLGPTEFRLLTFLMQHPDRAFDRAQLLDRVWGRSVYVEERTVDVHVLRLRRALKPFRLDALVETVRGVGYRLAPAAFDSLA